jgi:hypothetical protein
MYRLDSWFDQLTILSLCFDFARHPELIEGSNSTGRIIEVRISNGNARSVVELIFT